MNFPGFSNTASHKAKIVAFQAALQSRVQQVETVVTQKIASNKLNCTINLDTATELTYTHS